MPDEEFNPMNAELDEHIDDEDFDEEDEEEEED